MLNYGALGLAVLSCGLSGCSSLGLGYFIQAGRGQLELSNRARAIDDVVKDERTPPRIRELLARIPDVKKFGETQGLKPTKNYTEYVKLDRPAAVYVVSASESLRFHAVEWSFPIVGSFTYVGWFDLGDARKYAAEIARPDLDVDVRPARAYSTLGWFRDAVLSSMIPDGPESFGELVDVILHESTHATLYVNGQSYFNESMAEFVASKLTPLYLEKVQGRESSAARTYLKDQEYSDRYSREMHQAYGALEKLYASPLPAADKLRQKAAILSAAKEKVGARRDLNNATLIQFKTYGTGREEFEILLKSCSGDIGRMLRALSGVKPESFPTLQSEDLGSVLLPIAKKGC